MKVWIKLTGIIVITTMIGLVLWSCGDGDGGGSGLPALTGTVSITGTTQVGFTLTADTTSLDGSGDISYQWKRASTNIGSNSSVYIVHTEDVGSNLTVTVTRAGNSGSITSNPVEIIPTPGLLFTLLGGGNTYSVSKGTATASVIIIPAIHEGKPVTTIADNGFLGYTNLTSIILPNGITRIGSYAFYECTNLTSVVIPEVVVLGNFAFDGCSSLEKVFYRGATNLQWSSTMLSGQGLNNSLLLNANRFYYSETPPSTVNTHWHFLNGLPVVWTNHTVTFNSNGGSAVASRNVNSGNAVARPANPTRSGFGFDDWYSDEGLTTVYDFSKPVTSDITLYAKWFGPSTVTFNSNGGSSIAAQNITHGSTATRPTNPTRTGFVFDNWYSDVGLTTVYNFTTPVTSNITLFAKWFGPSTVTFNSNGGSTVSSQSITHGSTATRPTNPTRSGFVFAGWYSDAGLTTIYNFSTLVTLNITLFAKWNESIVSSSGIELIRLSAGTYTRGDSSISDALFPHQVTLTSGFYMGKYEVTQDQYQAVMGVNPSNFSSSPAAGETQVRRPVEMVTWFDAVEFCNKLSQIEGLTPVYTITGRTPATGYPITWATVTANWNANGYRLPTEAEWEYACRAGTTTSWSFGNDSDQLVNYAWFGSNSSLRTHEVGLKLPNAWGLFDMHGNVREWCWDWYASYSSGAQTDPRGPVSGSYRARRGGGYGSSILAKDTESGYRYIYDSNNMNQNLGFRVVRN